MKGKSVSVKSSLDNCDFLETWLVTCNNDPDIITLARSKHFLEKEEDLIKPVKCQK